MGGEWVWLGPSGLGKWAWLGGPAWGEWAWLRRGEPQSAEGRCCLLSAGSVLRLIDDLRAYSHLTTSPRKLLSQVHGTRFPHKKTGLEGHCLGFPARIGKQCPFIRLPLLPAPMGQAPFFGQGCVCRLEP